MFKHFRSQFTLILGFITICTITFSLAQTTLATGYTPVPPSFDPNSNIQRNTQLGFSAPTEVTVNIINTALGLLALIAVTLMVYAGFTWMTATGNEEKIQKAKDIMQGALIGAVVILASYGVTLYVFSNLINFTSTNS